MCPQHPESCNLYWINDELLAERTDHRTSCSVSGEERRCILASKRIRRVILESLSKERPMHVQQGCIVPTLQAHSSVGDRKIDLLSSR